MAFNDIHLDLKGVQGESKDAVYGQQMTVEEFSFAARAPKDAATGQASGKRHWSGLTYIKRVDAATPLLLKALAENTKIGKGILTLRKAGGGQKPYLTITLEDVYVEGYSVSSPDSELPKESVQLAYGKITVDYKKQESDSGEPGGTISFTDSLWNQAT